MKPLSCPVCGLALHGEEGRAVCQRGHSFDRAREGYFNFLMSSSTHGHGDDKSMLTARRAFLEGGFYAPLLEALTEEIGARLPRDGVLLDAGCGEGYYTKGILDRLRETHGNLRGFGLDVSKDAVKMTAKRLRRDGVCFVASVFAVPMEDASVDGILSVFSPYAEGEFLRLLKPGGYLFRAVPLAGHLAELKEALYEHPTENTAKASIGEGFEEEKFRTLRFPLELVSAGQIAALFEMTPYARKTSPEDRKKLEALSSLTVRAEFGIQILHKKLS